MKDRIKALRRAVKKSQTEFGQSVMVSLSAVQKWESGANEPSDAVITLLCRTYNADETWLRTGAGEMFRPRSREDEIASFMAGLLSGEGTEFQRRLVSVLARLSTEEWAKIEQKAREILDDGTKKDPVD